MAVAHNQGADPLGSADLVAGNREQRAIHLGERDRDLAERLNGIDVERHAGRAAARGEPGHRLDDADLVVHPHHAHHGDAALERRGERIFHHGPAGVDREHDLLAAQPGDRVRRGQHRLVLDRGDRDPKGATALTRGECAPDHREVVRLRAARREDHLAGLCAPTQRFGDRALRLLEARPGRAPETVRRRGIPEDVAPQIGEHRLEHFGAHRRRGRVVEIHQPLGHGGESRRYMDCTPSCSTSWTSSVS